MVNNRNTLKLVFGNLLVFFVLVLLADIALRIRGFDTYPGNQPKILVEPNGKYFQKDSLLGYKHLAGKFDITLEGDYTFSTQHDSLGLRVTGHSHGSDTLIKPEIWIFGCSFTHGWAINDEETFPWILQSKLEDYKIINWGTSGYGTIHFYLQLKEALERENKAEVVIINNADFHFERNSFSYNRRRNVSRWNFLGNLNQPFCNINDKGSLDILYSEVEYSPWTLSRFSPLAYFLQKKYEFYLDREKREQEATITGMLLDNIIALCKDGQISLILSNIAGDSELFQKSAQKNQIPYLDISVDMSLEENTNHPYDGHPSHQANEAYAEKIHSFLIDSTGL